MNSTRTYLIAGLMAACGLAVMLFWGLNSASLKVFSVSELLNTATPVPGNAAQKAETVQVYGRVVHTGNDAYFEITLADWEDPQQQLRVIMTGNHAGPKVHTLQPGQDVFLTGNLNPTKLFFEASELITACPSKYEAKRPSPQP